MVVITFFPMLFLNYVITCTQKITCICSIHTPKKYICDRTLKHNNNPSPSDIFSALSQIGPRLEIFYVAVR